MDLHGTTTPRFASVADAFARNFAEGREIGAAVAVHVDGELVVDLHAGVADPTTGREWADDTLQCVFSSSKAIVGLAIAMLVDRGVLDYDEPIATYWPEFAQHGKETITLRDVLCHRAGLPLIDDPLTRDDLADLDRLADAPRSSNRFGNPGRATGTARSPSASTPPRSSAASTAARWGASSRRSSRHRSAPSSGSASPRNSSRASRGSRRSTSRSSTRRSRRSTRTRIRRR